MRIPWFSIRQRSQLLLRSIEICMVGQDDIGTGLSDDVAETLGGMAISFKPELVRSFRGYVSGSVSSPVESCAAPFCCKVRLSSVLDWNESRDGAERVTGRQIQRQGRIA